MKNIPLLYMNNALPANISSNLGNRKSNGTILFITDALEQTLRVT